MFASPSANRMQSSIALLGHSPHLVKPSLSPALSQANLHSDGGT